MGNKNISVLVVNINNLEYTKNCITDLLSQTYKDFNITLIDQGSTEVGTTDYLNSLSDNKNINIIQNTENVSLNKLWNDFYLNSDSEYLCYLNNDVRLTKNFIINTLDILNTDDKVGIVIHSSNSFRYNKSLPELDYRFTKNKIKQGWEFTIRKSLYVPIPSLLEFYYGDDWLFHKIYEQNYEVAVCISSPILHFGEKSSMYAPNVYNADRLKFEQMGLVRYLPHYNEFNEVLPTFKDFGDNSIISIIYDGGDDINGTDLNKYMGDSIDKLHSKLLSEYEGNTLVNKQELLNSIVKITVNIDVNSTINKGLDYLILKLDKYTVLYKDYLPNVVYVNTIDEIYKIINKKKLTVLVPYKNREENLKIFIPYIRNFLKNNLKDTTFKIVIIEQCNDKSFNKGVLFNAGFILTSGSTDYYALHDVDQLPISANYSYNDKPFHLCTNAIEQSNNGKFLNPYKDTGYQQKGGAIIINKDNYIEANGHSNNYWGWGCIDDDFSIRLNFCKVGLWRYNNTADNGYYITLGADTDRFGKDPNYLKNLDYARKVLSEEIDWRTEGLNDVKFELLDTIVYDEYTLIKVDF